VDSQVAPPPEDQRITLKLRAPGAQDRPAEAPQRSLELRREVFADELSPQDQIIIETANSYYSFTLTEPKILAGRLIGGVLGNRQVNAAILPSWFAAPCGTSPAQQSFAVGSRLVFMLEWGDNLRQLTTSRITRLLHRRAAKKRSTASRQPCNQATECRVTRPLGELES
jgi:hypothetical protein